MTESKSNAIGVDNVIFQTHGLDAEAWNGVIEIDETKTGSEAVTVYVDGFGRHISVAQTDFDISVTAYTQPSTFTNSRFDLSYRTRLVDESEAYEIHILYNCAGFLQPDVWETLINNSVPTTYTLDITTKPSSPAFMGKAPGTHVVIRSDALDSDIYAAVEDYIYGSTDHDPRIPTLEDLVEFIESRATLRIIDHGDGTWTAIGPDDAVKMISATEFQINWPSAIVISPDSYIVSSL